MATYAIGDLQGCFSTFQNLLESIGFNPTRDRLWLVGDLINRGPDSLRTLRWIKDHEDCVTTVLGNHDLHAIAVHEGYVPNHRSDTLRDLLEAPDRAELFDWLRRQRMIHAEDDVVMIHAGLLPQWEPEQALELGAEVEAALQGKKYRDFFAQMYGNLPDKWVPELKGMDRLRLITNALTRLRICTPKGRMELKFTGEVRDIPEKYLPWFEAPGRRSEKSTLVFGHWSALGLMVRHNLLALDTGCLWGGQLTAVRLEDRRLFQVPPAPQDAIGR